MDIISAYREVGSYRGAAAISSIPRPTFDYLASLEWVHAAENLALVGPAGTGKSHLLVALGHAAVEAGHRVRYFTAADLVEALYRGLADNSVGRLIDQTLRHDLIIIDEIGFAPLDDTAAQLLFRLVAAAYERRSLAISSHLSEDGVTCRSGDDVTCRWVRRGDYGMAAPAGVRLRSLSR